jgi:hypothetical protein
LRHSRAKTKKIPCTNIPIRHFTAMLRKDYLLWIRTWRRMLIEVLLPITIFLILVIIRKNIPVKTTPLGRDLTRYMVSLGPFANPERLGLGGWESEDQLYREGEKLTMKDN